MPPPVATLQEAPPNQQLSPPPPPPAAPPAASTSGRQAGVEARPAFSQPPTTLPPATTRNLLVILHGKRVDDELLRNALQEVKQQGHQVSVRVTFLRGDVEQFVGEAVRLNASGTTNYQTIVAGGGDGTLNEVVAALMQHREAIVSQGLSVALIPLGTANDFAATSGISVDPREALRVALDPTTIRPIDVATVNGRPFLNVAVAGGLAEVPPDELSSKWKRLLGPVAIAWHVLKRLSSKRLLQPHACTTISFIPQPAAPAPTATVNQEGGKQVVGQQLDSSSDNKQQQQQQCYEFQTDLLMLVAGNSRQMGGTVAVCPDATLDDGLLDFTLLTGSSLAGQAATLVSALASRDDEDSALDSGIAQLRASRLVVCAQQGGVRPTTNSNSSGNDSSNEGGGGGCADMSIPVNRDGEPEEASHRLVFEVLHKVLPMHLPDDRLLVTGQTPKQQQQFRQHIIKGSIKQPGRELFVPASSLLPPPVSTASDDDSSSNNNSSGSSRRGRRWSRHRHRGLSVKALRRMLVLATPEGQGVRRRAHLIAVGRKLCVSLGVVLLGGVLGWVVGSRAAKADQQRQRQQDIQKEKEKEQQRAAAAAKQSQQAVSKQQRREQRRQEAARVATAAVV